MLGMTKKALCEGICSEKTIGRLEAKKTKPNIETVRLLFEKLNLSGEYQRWQVVTKDVKAFPILGEIIRCANNRDFQKTQTLLNQLEQYVSMENPINRQYREEIEINLKLRQGMITKEVALKELESILAYTIPLKSAIRKGDKYLTNVEIQCILDIAINMEKSSMNEFYEALIELCEQLEKDDGIFEHIAVWEIIMINVSNTYGEMGEFDKSDEISLNNMKKCVQCYRMSTLELNLYYNVWNYEERKKRNIPVQQGYQEDMYLKKCITLCQINKNIAREIRMKERLAKLKLISY